MALFRSAVIYNVYMYMYIHVIFLSLGFFLCTLYFNTTFHTSSRKMAIDLITLFLGFSDSKERAHNHSNASGSNIIL